jgi:hypothetical protein
MCFLPDFIPAIHAIFAHRVKVARKIRAPREYMCLAHSQYAPLIKTRFAFSAESDYSC